jgi:hypothetical protein
MPARNQVLIIAHPDDDIIWFQPILTQVDKVMITSMPLTYPHINIIDKCSYLSGTSYFPARGIASIADYKDHWLNPVERLQYAADYDLLLRDLMADPRVPTYYTHSPHGEYGHRHHREVSAAVCALAMEYGKDVWCPTIAVEIISSGDMEYYNLSISTLPKHTFYYSIKTYKNMQKFYYEEPVNLTFPFNYWTWEDGYPFPSIECEFCKIVDAGTPLFPMERELMWAKESLPVYG